MIVSPTEMQQFLRCQRQWDYASTNRQRLSPALPVAHLTLGKVIHAAHARWMMEPDAQLSVFYVVEANAAIEEAERIYVATMRAPLPEKTRGELHDVIHLGWRMCINYQAHWKTPLPVGFRVVSTEQQIIVPIPGTPHHIGGFIDALVESEGSLYILDRKTYNARPDETSLRYSEQFISYMWMMRQSGFDVIGIAYDGMWKREEPPRGKTMEDLFLRVVIEANDETLAEFESILPQRAAAMYQPLYIDRTRRYEGCWDCDFKPICTAQSRGEADTVETLRRTAYAERIVVEPIVTDA